LQRKLRDALSEVDEYKAKLEKATKEKEELREKLAQCEEAMKVSLRFLNYFNPRFIQS